ncbi:MAG: D-alanyl-D-alanine carboxypeptidase, partial [Lachnoanaerobaculum sp.]|nr:D-alanyl-D-alanine carboxypeptidase [Lachnoanaerobaculum sp.]
MKIEKIIAGGLSILLSVGVITFAPGNGMVTHAATPPNIASQGAALYNANTGEFLYEKEGNKQFFPASITKIMTTLLALEQA